MREFAVKKGRQFTTFSSSSAAAKYASVVPGCVLKYRDDGGRWRNLL